MAAGRHLAGRVAVGRGGVQGRRLVQLLLLLRLHVDVLVRLLVYLLIRGVVHAAANVQARAAHLQIVGAARREQPSGRVATANFLVSEERLRHCCPFHSVVAKTFSCWRGAADEDPTGAWHG